jgi:Fe-S cluster assembly protein SufD
MFQERLVALYPSVNHFKKEAFELAKSLQFPNRKVESYRKISLKEIENFELKGVSKAQYKVVCKDARVMPLKLEDAKKTYQIFLENRLKNRLKNQKDYFSALNDALGEDGLFFFIPPKTQVDEPIEIEMIFDSEGKHYFPQIQIYMARESSASFVLKYKFLNGAKSISNQLIDIYLDRDSKADFINEAIFDPSFLSIQALSTSLKRNSKLNYYTLTRGSNFFKQDLKAELLEEGAEVSLKGASKLSGSLCSHTNVLIEHVAANARSNQLFKGVLEDSSFKTFEGKIYVHKEAQKTEAYQLNNNLLLGKDASVFTKPNLEIFADDVKATHGATVAKLSEEELFYFQTRGISKETAKRFLAFGFLDEIVKDIPKWHSTPKL